MSKEERAIAGGFVLLSFALLGGVILLDNTIRREVGRVDTSIKGLPQGLIDSLRGIVGR